MNCTITSVSSRPLYPSFSLPLCPMRTFVSRKSTSLLVRVLSSWSILYSEFFVYLLAGASPHLHSLTTFRFASCDASSPKPELCSTIVCFFSLECHALVNTFRSVSSHFIHRTDMPSGSCPPSSTPHRSFCVKKSKRLPPTPSQA